jgi:putative nucleotidyltransferase with HDIG domain
MESKLRHSLNHLPAAFRPLAFVLVVVAISFLFPTDLQFKYQYTKQQSWRYDDLEAPFDFAIRKSEQEKAEERRFVLENTPPVFVLDTDIAKQRKANFSQAFQQQLQLAQQGQQFRDLLQQPELYLNYGLAFLDRVFHRGIIRLPGSLNEMPKDQVLGIIRANTFQEQTLGNLLTYDAALEMVSDSLPYSQLSEPEFLLPLLQEELQANLFYSPERTTQLQEEALSKIVTSRGLVQKGELIITKNSIITEELYQTLYSFEQEYEKQVLSKRSLPSVFVGYLLLTALVVFIFATYLKRFTPLAYQRFPRLIFILMWLVVFSYLVYVIEDIEGLESYLLPFCIVPIVIKTFYHERLALFTHIVVVLIAGILSSLGFEFVFLQILAGMVVVFSPIDTRDWSGFFYAILFIFLTYTLGYLGLSLIREENFWSIDFSVFSWFFLNAFLTLLAYPLIPLLERVFGFVSPITLVELSDMNKPLLRELAIKAPGTLQHSLQVGNLAEAAARRINADPLLVKVAALYHDIGKTKQPTYFIENQSGRNPHDNLSPLESAKIIISHVADGVALAKKAGLPPLLIDFILTHHGTTQTAYFYHKYLQQLEEGAAVDEDAFRYPGPRPRSKEEVILMMADSIEAACKSLKDPSEEELYQLIDKIVDRKIASGQFQEALISFRELEECRLVFRQIMRSVYHVRVAYEEE